MNKKWKRTAVLGGLTVILMAILRRRKKTIEIGRKQY